MRIWTLYNQAQTFSQLPSNLLGYEHAWVRWMFDNAVFFFGRHVDNKLHQVDEKGKPKYTIEQALNLPPKPVSISSMLSSSSARVKIIRRSKEAQEA